MREILFRGRDNTGVWHYGDYTRWAFTGKPCICDEDRWHEVDPDKVGQFTGLLDKNGKKIFEGDVVKTVEGPFKVVCEHGAFWLYDELLLSNDHLDFLGAYKTEAIEVIGNIHDNPELLEEPV